MTTTQRDQRRPLSTASIKCVIAALVVVLVGGTWGVCREIQATRQRVMQSAIAQTRSHAERSVGRIEAKLVEEQLGTDLARATKADWFSAYWKRTVPGSPDRLFGTIVSPDGIVLSHTDPTRIGDRLPPDWGTSPLRDFGIDVYLTQNRILGDVPAVDIAIPIGVKDEFLGMYHTGLSMQWLDRQVAESGRRSMHVWLILAGGTALVAFLSTLAMYWMARHAALAETAVQLSDARRVEEVGQLVTGMAHEFRNPLNAVRLNLFTAERVFRGEASFDQGELSLMLNESVREIERIDDLIQQLLGYARPEQASAEILDALTEVRHSTLFLKSAFDQAAVTVEVIASAEPALVRMERSRFRQVFLNLIKNALEAVQALGYIIIRIRPHRERVELVISDSGPGIPEHLQERIFEPFYTTKESGTGLGLAVVRNLVEIAGGTIHYSTNADGCGSRFSISLPRVFAEAGDVA